MVGKPGQIREKVSLCSRGGDHPKIVIRPAIDTLGSGKRSNCDKREHPIIGCERLG